MVTIQEESSACLNDYAAIPIAFTVERIFNVLGQDGDFRLRERRVESPYEKNYDAIEGNHPREWANRFDIRNWGFLAALAHQERVGSAVIAGDTPGLDLLGGRKDLAVLWDLRVSPEARRMGVGRTLFEAAERWVKARGYRELLIETQDVNVPACRFYERAGCTLIAANSHAYAGLPNETQLLWSKRLSGPVVGFAIRVARDEDWEMMRDIFAQAGQVAWRHILPSPTLAELSAPDRWHPTAGPGILVAESAGKVVGFVCARASADTGVESTVGEIDACYVLPSVWGMGVGRALLAAAAEHLATSGFKEATLWTEHRNERPLRFYHAAGWSLDGTERRRVFLGTELLELRHRLILRDVRRKP